MLNAKVLQGLEKHNSIFGFFTLVFPLDENDTSVDK